LERPNARVLDQPTELLRRDASIFEDLPEKLRSDPFCVVNGEKHRPAVLVHKEPMTSTSAGLAESGAQKRGQNPTGGKLREPSHRSGGDFDLDGHKRLSRRLLTLVPK
jgi:hypothetical protein